MYLSVVFAVLLGVCMGGMMPGGPTVLKDADKQTMAFEGFLKEAEKKCNEVGNSEKWFMSTGQFNGTKQVVAGIVYTFNLTQQETECDKKAMLETDENEPRPSCIIKEDGLVQICSVCVHSKLWFGTPTISVQIVKPDEKDTNDQKEKLEEKEVVEEESIQHTTDANIAEEVVQE